MNDLLKYCIVYDSPGLHNSDNDDSRTLGSLAFMDYFCYTFSGNFSESDLDDISNPVISDSPNAIQFIMTRQDGKDPARTQQIFCENKEKVASLPSFVENNIIPDFCIATPKDKQSMSKLLEKLLKQLENSFTELLKKRREEGTQLIAMELRRRLMQIMSIMKYDPSQLEASMQDIYKKIDDLLNAISQLKKRFDLAGDKIGKKLKNQFALIEMKLLTASSDKERKEIIITFVKGISPIVQYVYKNDLGISDDVDIEYETDMSKLLHELFSLNHKFEVAGQVGDLFTLIGSACLMAGLGPATGAGNFVEGLLGAFLSANVGSSLDQLRKFNPVALLSDLSVDVYMYRQFSDSLNKMEFLGKDIAKSTYIFFDKLIIQQKYQEIEQEKRILEEHKQKIMAGRTKFIEDIRKIEQVIKFLPQSTTQK